MKWDDVQISFFNPDISLLGLVDNVGNAESKGFEVDATLVPTANLELSFSYAFNEAERLRTTIATQTVQQQMQLMDKTCHLP